MACECLLAKLYQFGVLDTPILDWRAWKLKWMSDEDLVIRVVLVVVLGKMLNDWKKQI